MSHVAASAKSAAGGGPLAFLARRRIPLGFAFAAAFVLTARPTPWSLLAGAPPAALGLAVRAFASGFIRKNKALATRGPYRLCRNPLYLGSFLLTCGFAIMAGRWPHLIAAPALFLIVYRRIILIEEAKMETLFGDDWRRFKAEAPRLFPRALPLAAMIQDFRSNFEASLVIRHGEYNAWIGAAGLCALMAAMVFYGFHFF